MVKTTDVRNSSKERDLFWEAYRGCAEENRVRPDRSPFYVRWAKDFDSFLQDKSLKDRSRKDTLFFMTRVVEPQSLLNMVDHYQKRIDSSRYSSFLILLVLFWVVSLGGSR